MSARNTSTFGQLENKPMIEDADIFAMESGANGQLFNITAVEIAAYVGSGSSVVGHIIQDEGDLLTPRTNLNFVGPGVLVTDDAGNDATVVTIDNDSLWSNFKAISTVDIDSNDIIKVDRLLFEIATEGLDSGSDTGFVRSNFGLQINVPALQGYFWRINDTNLMKFRQISGSNNTEWEILSTISGAKPIMKIINNDATIIPLAELGRFEFVAKNDASQNVIYSEIKTEIHSITDNSENGSLKFNVMLQGTLTEFMRFNSTGDGNIFALKVLNHNGNDIVGADRILFSKTSNGFNQVGSDNGFVQTDDGLVANVPAKKGHFWDVVGVTLMSVRQDLISNDDTILTLFSDIDEAKPRIEIVNHDSTPTVSEISTIDFIAKNNNVSPEDIDYASIHVNIESVVDGTEDGSLHLNAISDGVDTTFLSLNDLMDGKVTAKRDIKINKTAPTLDFESTDVTPGLENNLVGDIMFKGNNDATELIEYGRIFTKIISPADSAESGEMELRAIQGGTEKTFLTLNKSGNGIIEMKADGQINMLLNTVLEYEFKDNQFISHQDITITKEEPLIIFKAFDAAPLNKLAGEFRFENNNSDTDTSLYGQFFVKVIDPTAGSEDAEMDFKIRQNGTLKTFLIINPGGNDVIEMETDVGMTNKNILDVQTLFFNQTNPPVIPPATDAYINFQETNEFTVSSTVFNVPAAASFRFQIGDFRQIDILDGFVQFNGSILDNMSSIIMKQTNPSNPSRLHVKPNASIANNAPILDIAARTIDDDEAFGRIVFTANVITDESEQGQIDFKVASGSNVAADVLTLKGGINDAAALIDFHGRTINNIATMDFVAGGGLFGSTAAQKIGFWGATPVIQPLHIVDPTDPASTQAAVIAILAQLAATGLQASS